MAATDTLSNDKKSNQQKIYTIIGEPIALARPRFSTKGEKVHVFDSQAQAKVGTQLQLKSQHHQPIITCPIHMNIAFFFEASTKHPEKSYHCQKPDLDNLVKWLLDNASGIIFKDDAQVYSICAHKSYDRYARTEFTVVETSKE